VAIRKAFLCGTPQPVALRDATSTPTDIRRQASHIGQRQVSPDVSEVAEVGEKCPYDGLGLAAVGALEVAVLHQGHLRIRRAADVVAEKPQYWVTGDAESGAG
jgi:hypothetical protein